MSKRTVRLVLAVTAIMASSVLVAYNTSIQTSVKSGSYNAREILTISSLRLLPVPRTNEDYSLLQSIGKVTSIVIGSFSTGEKSITLVQDKDSDGKVDFAATWFVERQRFQVYSQPEKRYPEDKFKKMKEDIFYGRSGDVIPNQEGIDYMLELARHPENVRKWKQGYQVFMLDTDDPSRVRVDYSVSNNGDPGADAVFIVNYRNLGAARVSPIITRGIYCFGSHDPFIKEMTKKLTESVAKAYGE